MSGDPVGSQSVLDLTDALVAEWEKVPAAKREEAVTVACLF